MQWIDNQICPPITACVSKESGGKFQIMLSCLSRTGMDRLSSGLSVVRRTCGSIRLVPIFFKNRLHLEGRPQMSTRPS